MVNKETKNLSYQVAAEAIDEVGTNESNQIFKLDVERAFTDQVLFESLFEEFM